MSLAGFEALLKGMTWKQKQQACIHAAIAMGNYRLAVKLKNKKEPKPESENELA